ncbi:hypothetical protein CPB84DRAFT_1755400 [Gymnopilus junonius]|uniref:Uncharacterized protein n=1 Tax=Gymnopilus junonius TaxID=109634 RepID=A0A9P5N6P4_GYMJU|nr:hypothetical protein CPB84DRAFT_1755400 [Gymnopilus junonius]
MLQGRKRDNGVVEGLVSREYSDERLELPRKKHNLTSSLHSQAEVEWPWAVAQKHPTKMPMSDSVLQTRFILSNKLGAGGQPSITLEHAAHSLSLVTSREDGGSSDSSGDDGHWVPEGQAATSSLLFNVRKVGSALSRERRWAKVGSPPCLVLIFPTEEGGKLAVAALGWVIEAKIYEIRKDNKRKRAYMRGMHVPTSSLEGGARAVAEREEEESGGRSERERAGSMTDRLLISFRVCRSGIHVNSWVPVLAGHPSHCETHGVTWQQANAASSNTAGQGIPARAVAVNTTSSFRIFLGCVYPRPLICHTTTPPSALYVLSSAGGNAPRQQCSAATTITCISPAEPIATSSLPRPPVSVFTPMLESWMPFWLSALYCRAACDVIAASAALCSLANPEKALIILDQWVMQPRFAKGVLLVFPLSCCIVLKVFISVWGEEKGRSCCFASS